MNVALGVEYDGAAFHGFQRQSHAPSVQGTLEAALSRVADAPVRIVTAGRTDTGVHATGQVVSFTPPTTRPDRAWMLGTNALTPAGVKVRWVRRVDDAFHARFSASARRYLYLFHEDRAPSPLMAGRATPSPPLDDQAMHRAAQALVGEHDFSAFRAAACQSESVQRRVHRIAVHRVASFVVIDVTANAYLLRMVRNIAGALARVGGGEMAEGWIAEMLARRDRTLIGRTAHPDGLYLVDVQYPGYELPHGRLPPLLAATGSLDRFDGLR